MTNPMRLTYAEWAALLLAGAGIGPNPENWALVPVVGLAGLGVYALRRAGGFRERVGEMADKLWDAGAPEFAVSVFERLAVPPAGASEQLALPAPPPEYPERRRTTLDARRELSPLSGGFGAFGGLWGDDDPRKAARNQTRRLAQTGGVQPGRPRNGGVTRRLPNPEGRVTQQMLALPAPRDDIDWLRQEALNVMPLKELAGTINDDPDTYPFVIVFGPPRTGKTTLAQLIALTRPGKLVILDPKQPQGWKGAKWGGLPYVSKDENGSYQPMIDALTMGYLLMEGRYKKQATATREFEPVTFIIDEAQVVVNECPEIGELYKAILSKGAEARVRLVLTSTTDRAGALGFKGTADNIEGFVPIRLGNFAKKVLPDVVSLSDNPKHWAVVNLSEWQAFDNSKTPQYLKIIGQRPGKVWERVRYNCQVPNWDLEDEPEDERRTPEPQRSTARRSTMAVAAKRAMPETPTQDANDLLAGLLELGGVSNVSRAEPAREPLELQSANGTSGTQVPNGTDDGSAGSEGSAMTVESAKSILKTASPEEARNLIGALKLLTVLGKEAATMHGFNLTSKGRGYKRAKQLIDAAKFLEQKGLLTR